MVEPQPDPELGIDVVTERGIEKVLDAVLGEDAETATGDVPTDRRVRIKYIALGDANGTAYDPDPAQTALVNERLRMPVSTQYRVGPKSYLVKAFWPPETEIVTIREMGFFDEDGELICLWSGAGVTRFSHTGAHEYFLEHTLNFSGTREGAIIVDAPLDEYMAFMKATNASFALAFHDIFKLQTGAAS